MEMLLDHGVLRFMEMNCRLQVEHTVSEERTGMDLVHRADRGRRRPPAAVEAGRPRADRPRDRVPDQRRGSGEQLRAGARHDHAWQPPSGDGIRVDTHVEAGLRRAAVLRLAAREADRARHATATTRSTQMLAALAAFEVEGVPTTIPMHRQILASEAFRTGPYDTRSIPGWP